MDSMPECQSAALVEDDYLDVTDILQEAGVPTKGYVYLRDAILMVLRYEKFVKPICKQLYPLVAWKHHPSPSGEGHALAMA